MPVVNLPSAPLEGAALKALTLEDLAALALVLPAEGLKNAASPLRKPVLSTRSEDGAPSLRTVILRGMDRAACRLAVFTDARSSKAVEIEAEPRVSMLFYDPASDIQVRFSGKAAIHREGELADKAWADAAAPSRRAYLAEAAPGTPAPGPVSGLPRDVEGIIPPLERLEEGRRNFALIEFIFDEADVVVLSRSGHRRARIRFSADAARGEWLYP